MTDIEDIIEGPAERKTYEVLKGELLKRNEVSTLQKSWQRLEDEPMGDCKPSQFLQCLRDLAKGKITVEVLGKLWLGRLPHNLQTSLEAHQAKPLENQS